MKRGQAKQKKDMRYIAFNVYCRELAPISVSLTGDRVQGDDSKHCAYSSFDSFRQLRLICFVTADRKSDQYENATVFVKNTTLCRFN